MRWSTVDCRRKYERSFVVWFPLTSVWQSSICFFFRLKDKYSANPWCVCIVYLWHWLLARRKSWHTKTSQNGFAVDKEENQKPFLMQFFVASTSFDLGFILIFIKFVIPCLWLLSTRYCFILLQSFAFRYCQCCVSCMQLIPVYELWFLKLMNYSNGLLEISIIIINLCSCGKQM